MKRERQADVKRDELFCGDMNFLSVSDTFFSNTFSRFRLPGPVRNNLDGNFITGRIVSLVVITLFTHRPLASKKDEAL